MKVETRASNLIDVAVGLRLRLRRNEFGMSQGALAAKLGISFQQVQKYEKGTNRISSSRLAAIAECLEVPVSYLFDGTPTLGAGLPVDAAELKPDTNHRDVLELNKAFSGISDPIRRQAIIELIKVIAEKIA